MNTVGRKTAVVTGTSSGIGRACVARLIRSGWRVFATVRKSQDGDGLRFEFGTNLTPMVMDVTDRETISSAAEQISNQLNERGLDALVNVAGIGMIRPMEYATAADMQEIFNINVFGQISVTQAFLPLLRESQGRIVNISSVGAHIALPFGGLLNASKSAFGLLSDTLRLELRPFGIRVCTVEPGSIRTPAVKKTLGHVEEVIHNMPSAGVEQYGQMLKTFAERAYAMEMGGSTPDVVARAVHHALTSYRPKIRYRVGKHAGVLTALPRLLPDRLLDEVVLRMTGLPTRFGERVAKDRRAGSRARQRPLKSAVSS